MPDILHNLPVAATPRSVFAAVSQPVELDRWWTMRSAGQPEPGSEYQLFFGPEWDWRAVVMRAEHGRILELQLTVADDDWRGTCVGFELRPQGAGTGLRFSHKGWSTANDHYCTTSYCWAMYLRVLRRYLEHGEVVPYERRLDV